MQDCMLLLNESKEGLMTLHVLKLGKAFWMRPGFGFMGVRSEPFRGANIAATVMEFINKRNLFVSHIFLRFAGITEQRVLFVSDKFLNELEKRGIPFPLQSSLMGKKWFGQVFYYHVMSEDEITAYDAFLSNPDEPVETIFEQTLANLLDSMLREPVENNVELQLRADELISLGNKVSFAHFTDQGKYELLDAIHYLCHSKAWDDTAITPQSVIEKIVDQNGWVKQFPPDKVESSGT